MNFNKLVTEIYDTNVNKSYPASSSAPRKDFAPVSSRDGYHHPYQNPGAQNIEQEHPDNPISYPYPLQTVSDDLAQSFVFLLNGTTKIIEAQKNKSLNINQKNDLNKLKKYCLKILDGIKKVAFKVDEISDLGVEKTPEIKINASQSNNPNSLKQQEVSIKLPTK